MPRSCLRHAGLVVGLVATGASAQAVAPPDPPFSVVPADARLSLSGVFMDADPVVKLLMTLLVIAVLATLVAWISSAVGPRRERSGAVAFLGAVSAAGPLVGLLAAAYTLLNSMIGLANVRPAPTASIMAPGYAEALLSVTLGLLAAVLAVIGRHHLKARFSGQTAQVPRATRDGVASPSPSLRAAG